MAEGALRELLVHWGVEVDEEPLERLESHLEGIKKGFEHVGERLMEYFAFREMKEFVLGTVEMGAHLQDMSDQLGLTTQELQKFQFAASLGGVEAGTAAHSLGLFTRQLGEAASGGGEAGKALQQIGVHFKDTNGQMRPTLDILEDVADHIKATDNPAKNAALAMKLFGRTGLAMVPMLKDGGEGVRKLYDEFDKLGGGLSDEFIKSAKETDDEIQKMKLGITSLRGTLVQMMLPSLKEIVDKFLDWSKALVDMAKQTHVFQHIWDFAKIIAIVKAFQMMIPIFRAIAAGEGLIDALNPFTWLVIGAIALFAILDDLWTMMEGGKSVIGDALGPEKAQFVMDLRDDFNVLSGAAHELMDFFSGDGTKNMDTFTATVVALGKALKYVADLVAAVVEGGKAIGEGIGGLLFHEAGKDKNGGLAEGGLTPEARAKLDEIQGSGKGKYNISGGDTHADKMLQIMQQMVAEKNAHASLPPAQVAGLSGTNVPGYQGPSGPAVQINKMEVNVQHTGNEDPKKLAGQIATGTRSALDKQLVNANNTLKRK